MGFSDSNQAANRIMKYMDEKFAVLEEEMKKLRSENKEMLSQMGETVENIEARV